MTKHFPRQLEWIRSQMRELNLAQKQSIIERSMTDSRRTDLVKIAVIDSGVDVAHPDLIDQIEYRVQEGRIVGAGFDIMGAGPFASHVLVDPTLFAFGAERIDNGRIVNPLDSPLALLKEIDSEFKRHLIGGIQADADLRNSFFAKLTAENFTIAGFNAYLGNQEAAKAMLEHYIESKSNNKVINPRSTEILNDQLLSKALKVAQTPHFWKFDTIDHAPDPLGSAPIFEHFDKFYELVSRSLREVNQKYNYEENLKKVAQFLEPKEVINPERFKVPEQVLRALLFNHVGYHSIDPIKAIEAGLQKSSRYGHLSFEEGLRQYYRDIAAEYENIRGRLNEYSKETREILESKKESIHSLKALIESYIELRHNPSEYRRLLLNLRRYYYRTNHPYISEKSNANSHGTHVAGIVAKQHENIRVIPIRVMTETFAVHESREESSKNQFMLWFNQFKNSVYYPPLKKMILKEYGISNEVSDAELTKHLEAFMRDNKLNLMFVQEVIEAVNAAGAAKAKIANVSLGTTFRKGHTQAKQMASVAEDIFAEIARYQIGKAMIEKAPGTLFVVATGNDGGWLDGVSKTGFPVGITSLRLIEVAKQHSLPSAPNNRLKNLLAVGSVSVNGNLTSFTNILIDPNTPQIFSTGEEVAAPVPGKDKTLSDQLNSPQLKPLRIFFETLQSTSMEINSGSGESFYDLLAKRELQKILLDTSPAMIAHLESPINRQKMSGTSMATPTVTGLLGSLVAKKAQALRLDSRELYLHPDFAPERLIQEAMAVARSNQMSQIVTVKMLLDGIKTWQHQETNLGTQKIHRMLRLRCESVYISL
ncbi:MAG: S8 family serine peptidase [Proteobacteria bacterium]|jgi:subtilisin family serine protease|nr:S8 family serine peptidase [Pseudomonadota bacterium]